VEIGKYAVMLIKATRMKIMSRAFALGVGLVMGLAMVSGHGFAMETPEERLLQNNPALCAAGASQPAALLRITGFKDRTGKLRIQSYTDSQKDLLEKGKYINRILVPMTASDDVMVCMPLPKAGRYVMFIVHDRNADNAMGLSDGAAFSNNPKLRFGFPKPPKPNAAEASFDVKNGAIPLDIRMNYLSGLSIKPIDSK
jgi:uncharacterized protein (DUF2141 family)